MQLLVRFGFILLLIGGLFLTPVAASASEQKPQQADVSVAGHVNERAQLKDQSQLQAQVKQGVDLAVLSLPDVNSITLKDNHAQKKQGDDSEYAPLVSSRFVSFSQHDPQQTRPEYLLAFEFISPAVPSLTVGYRVEFTPALDWLLHIPSSTHRLSAWKESNLLYRFSQARAIS
ncbi:hypothetical protein L1D44_03040 [Shewanella sp. Isolate13]|uniref:hypothetical protein n=1 Tax=Shewanella sp. Isolate13 TaxID=2908531 RepID=UPI001EFEB00D|nr:hypothetical protein [Shewanella sp. Isolate13]MCG9728832.1 hypothetical protein [Shewanella sp. Isolate13]